jgi:hypothetical protein
MRWVAKQLEAATGSRNASTCRACGNTHIHAAATCRSLQARTTALHMPATLTPELAGCTTKATHSLRKPAVAILVCPATAAAAAATATGSRVPPLLLRTTAASTVAPAAIPSRCFCCSCCRNLCCRCLCRRCVPKTSRLRVVPAAVHAAARTAAGAAAAPRWLRLPVPRMPSPCCCSCRGMAAAAAAAPHACLDHQACCIMLCALCRIRQYCIGCRDEHNHDLCCCLGAGPTSLVWVVLQRQLPASSTSVNTWSTHHFRVHGSHTHAQCLVFRAICLPES